MWVEFHKLRSKSDHLMFLENVLILSLKKYSYFSELQGPNLKFGWCVWQAH